MKTIAFVATGYIRNYDGISVYTENILRELLMSEKVQSKELFVDIYTGKDVVELLAQRLFVDTMQQKNIRFIAVNNENFYKKIINLIINLRSNAPYDLIFMTNFMPTLFLGSKTIKVIHDFSVNLYPNLYSKFYLFYHNMLIQYAKYFDEGIAYISKTTLNDMKRFHNIDETNKNLLYVPNGIPFKVKNYARPKVDDIEAKYSSNNLDLLVVGRINKHKGFDRILEFCEYYDKKLTSSTLFNKVTLHIVGKQTNETESMLQDLNLQNITLLFHGFLDDDGLNSLYAKAHFCFFLSRNEGYGLPLIEAMWFRCIPILSDIPIFNEIMGSAYPKFDDASGYTNAIEEFIEETFLSQTYRKNITTQIETIVLKESDGYKLASNNLLVYIDNLIKKGTK